MTATPNSAVPTDKDEAFSLDQPAEFSAETLERGTRYPTEAERASLIKSIASLPIDDEAAPAAPAKPAA